MLNFQNLLNITKIGGSITQGNHDLLLLLIAIDSLVPLVSISVVTLMFSNVRDGQLAPPTSAAARLEQNVTNTAGIL